MAYPTTKPLKFAPSASTGVSLTGGVAAWAFGSWVEVIASAADDLAVAGLVFTANTSDDWEVDIGVGGIGAEVSIAILRGQQTGSPRFWSLPIPIDNVPSGSRVALRVRNTAGGAVFTAVLAYYESFDSESKTTEPLSCAPLAGNAIGIAANTSAWANTGWTEMIAACATSIELCGATINVPFLGTYPDVEVDIGAGGAGVETVLTTMRFRHGIGGNGELIMLPAPYPVSLGTRLSVRIRKSGTSAGTYYFALVFYVGSFVEPIVATRAATHVRRTTATLNGRINPNGTIVTGHFEWDVVSSPQTFGNVTGDQSITAGTSFIAYSTVITGLSPGTTYAFRAVADDGALFYGEILYFTTVEEVDFEFTDGTASHPLVMREFVDRQGTSYVAAEVDLNDPGPFTYGGTGYEHGYKEPRILGVDIISRGLSDAQGQLEHLAFGLTEHDTDYFWRTLLAESPGGGSPISRRYLTNRPLILKIIDDEDRRALKPWRVVANGYISDYTALPNLKFRETGTDWIKKRFSRSFRAQYAWQRLIDLDDFPNADAILTTGDNTQVHVDAVAKAVPVIYGKVSDAGLLDADPIGVPVGVYKPIYAGDIVIGGDTYRTAVICGHAALIVNAYVDDVEVDLTSDPDWLTPNNPTAWSGAGFATDYTDLNGRRYFIIYIKGTAGDLFAGITQSAFGGVGITLNVWGVEDVGDGTGTVIDNPVLQHKHFVMNYLAPSAPYDSDDWLTVSPTFETLPTLTLMDEESFEATAAFINDRLVAGEYVTAGVIGANGELVGAEDALAWWKNTAYYEDYFNRKGQYGVTLEPAGAVGGEVRINDIITVVDGSLSLPEQVTSQFWNDIPFVHTRDYTGRRSSGWHAPNAFDTARTYLTFRTTMTEAIDDTSVANYEQAMKAPRFDLHFGWAFTAQGTLTIVDALIRRLNSFTNPRRHAIFTGPFSLTSVEPGQVFKLSTLDGIDPGGWANHYVRAVRHAVDLSKGNVQLECYDIGLVWGDL